jgi:ceramide glucosyltransferase
MGEVVALGVAGAYLLIGAVRIVVAALELRRRTPTRRAEVTDVTVLQAIRSGDPLLGSMLRENLEQNPDVRFVWLVDVDDPEGVRVAQGCATACVDVVVTPPLRSGNPKVVKLMLGLPMCGGVVAVLDDDTVLPSGALASAVAALEDADLVTGIPVYREQGTVWSRLAAAFVNGSSLLTYLPMTRRRAPITINGMFYVTRRETLEGAGGFAAIRDLLCDDYEIARLYRAHGLRIAQTAVIHPLATTVSDGAAYLRIMRRWMVFARQVIVRDLSAALVLVVVVPAVLPPIVLLTAVLAGSGRAFLVASSVLVAKAMGTAVLRGRVPVAPVSPAGVLAEVAADLLLPLHMVSAAFGRQVTWRGRELGAREGALAQSGGTP